VGWAVFDGLRQALQALKQTPNAFPHGRVLENQFSKTVSSLLRQQGYRAASLVNLWQLAVNSLQERDPGKILKAMKHPLQPDIDLLVEDYKDGNRLTGFEIKIVRWHPSSFRKIAPRARLYTGLDQALSLTTYGLDYVCLWHIFVPSMAAYRKAAFTEGEQFAEQFDDDRIEFALAYSGIPTGILNNFHLPIGYIATGVFLDQAADHPLGRLGVAEVIGNLREPRLLRLEPTETGSRIRRLLQKAFID